MADITTEGYISGTKAHGIKEFLWDLAIDYGVQLKILDEDKGWIRHAVYYQITGDPQSIQQFNLAFNQSIEAFKSERGATK